MRLADRGGRSWRTGIRWNGIGWDVRNPLPRLFHIGLRLRGRRVRRLRPKPAGRQMRISRLDGSGKRGAFAFPTLHAYRATVHPNQFLHKRQSDPSALMGTGLRSLDTVESVKQTRQLVRRDSNPGIRHRELGMVAAPRERDADIT